jgi:putative peptidoglycan lipid II flippase
MSTSTATSLIAITICALIQVMAQVVFQVLIAKNFGSSAEVDAFSAALAIPSVLAAVLTSSISYIMVPLLVPLAQEKQREMEFRQVAFGVGVWSIGACVLASLLLAFASHYTVDLLYYRFSHDLKTMTSQLLFILSPIVAMSALQGWLQGIYHSRQNFMMPALASAAGPAIVTSLLFIPIPTTVPVHWLAWTLVIGTCIAILMLLPAIRFGIPSMWKLHPTTTMAIRRSIPLLFLNSYTKVDPILDRVLLAGLSVGAIAHLNYAQRFVTALVLVVSSGVSTMAFSDLAGAAPGQADEFQKRLYENMRRMILVVVPVFVGLILFAFSSIEALLQRGAFTAHDTSEVAIILIALSGYFVAAAVGDLVAKSYYALGDTRTPSLIGAASFTLGVGLKFFGVAYWGVWGLALATSVYTLLSVAIMIPLLFRKLQVSPMFREVFPTAMRAFFATGLGCALAAVILKIPIDFNWWMAVMAGATVYGGVLWGLRDPSWLAMIRRSTPPIP